MKAIQSVTGKTVTERSTTGEEMPAIADREQLTSCETPQKPDQSVVLRVFVYKKASIVFSCCYDLDLVSQGRSQEESLHNLEKTVLFYLNSEFSEGKTFEQIKRRPPLYFRLKFAYVLFRALVTIFRSKFSDRYRVISARYNPGELIPFEYLTV